ncbi:unnamed protein product [Rotaria magnacalcarata]|uniref:Uncharacterized protein n=2 Tax=Rotaria magnacalcarata TaxID=392030 RepID=A0A816CJW1_9BILA|nr:unnamed protein product [Rotaria magnacalcarata]CAF4111137.1 unnamed protein product [Rotaria magnacalcarata]
MEEDGFAQGLLSTLPEAFGIIQRWKLNHIEGKIRETITDHYIDSEVSEESSTTSTTTTRCPDICWVENCETGNRTTIPCPNTTCATTIVPTITTTTIVPTIATTTTVASLNSDCSALQAELTRVKLGLGIGLGSGMAITSGLAAGSYIYFTRRLAQLPTAGFLGGNEITRF